MAAVAPDFFPNLICWLAFIFGVGLAIQGALEIREARISGQPAGTTAQQEDLDPEEKRIAIIARV